MSLHLNSLWKKCQKGKFDDILFLVVRIGELVQSESISGYGNTRRNFNVDRIKWTASQSKLIPIVIHIVLQTNNQTRFGEIGSSQSEFWLLDPTKQKCLVHPKIGESRSVGLTTRVKSGNSIRISGDSKSELFRLFSLSRGKGREITDLST